MKRLVTEGAGAVGTAGSADAEVSARDRVRKKRVARKRRRILITTLVIVAICAALAGAYAYGYSYYSSHYYPGTIVAGVDAAGMTEAELIDAINARIASYEAKVGNGSYELGFSGSDVNLACDADKVASTLMIYQDVSTWPMSVLGSNARTESSVEITFDRDKLKALVDESVATYNKTARQPVPATIKLNADKKAFSAVPEKEGTVLDAISVCATVGEAVAQGHSNIELSSKDLVQPTYTENGIETVAALETANQIISHDVTLSRSGTALTKISPATFIPWIVVNDDMTLGVKPEEVATYADGDIWQYTDYADDTNIYTIDTAGLGQALSDFMKAGGTGTLEVPYTAVPRYLPGGGKLNPATWNSSVGRYIDVNKAAQVACLYDETGRVLWETVVTTGNEAAGCGTPTGQSCIYDKKTDFMLIGFDNNGDGKPDYEHHVDYWMPFNEGIGLHDASWRAQYGGDYYLQSGSGGCVNIPLEAVTELYKVAHVGDVVIVH